MLSPYSLAYAFKFVINQGVFFVIGFFLMLAISHIKYDWYYKKSNILLLLLVAFGTRNFWHRQDAKNE